MAPTLRSFTRPIVQAFADAGIADQLDNFNPPLFTSLYSPPPSGRGRHARSVRARPTEEGRMAAMRRYDHRPLPENCAPRFVGETWMVMHNEAWEEMRAEEERGRKARRATRLRAERRRGLGREGKKRAFLGGRKGKVVEGGRKRHGAGAVEVWKDGTRINVGGRFRSKGM